MQIMYTIQLVLSWLMIIAVILPFVRNDYWIFKILEYPRYQKFIICAILFLSFFITRNYTGKFTLLTLILLGFCMAYLVYKIWPYTPFAKKEMKKVKNGDPSNQVKLYTANVFQDNRSYDRLLAQVKKINPDVILLLETDKGWEKAMQEISNEYPHVLKEPLENTYGLLFYSRFPIVDGGIKYMVEDDVPSIEVTLQMPSGANIKLWGLHPKPPV